MKLLSDADSTSLDYWLHWRVFLCALWVFPPMVVALFMIRKYEDFSKGRRENSRGDVLQQRLCDEDVWRPCLREIHPAWLLAFRVLAFCFSLATIIIRVVSRGWRIYYYYTQWTFTLVTIYFGFGSLLSIYGCCHYKKSSSKKFTVNPVGADMENGCYVPLTFGENMNVLGPIKTSDLPRDTKASGICAYLFRVIFQTSAGAVVLTDCIYWSIIFPFLAIKDYELSYMTVNMHTTNLILLLCDTTLSSLDFPLFRISYFVLWTGAFVMFQWIIHACVSVWWPYPFLDLSSPLAPLWYLSVALLHVPCYGLFALFIKLKHHLLLKWFPQTYVRTN